MKFRSTTGEPIHIAMTTGHTAVVGTELTELDKIFHKEAIARGALPEGVDDDSEEVGKGFDRAAKIVEVLTAMVNGSTEGDFNNDGRPALKRVNERLGFTATREEVDAAWVTVSESIK